MTKVFDCREEGVKCEYSMDTVFRAEVNVDKWDEAYGTGKDGEVISEMLLMEMNHALNCNIGISAVDKDDRGLRIAINHDCSADEKTIMDVAYDTIEKMEREMDNIKEYAFLYVEDGRMMFPKEHAEIAEMSENCIIVEDEETFVVSPTRECINEIRSAFATKEKGLHVEEMWKEAKDWGERIMIEEDLIGSYIYYKIPPKKPISASTCYNLFDAGVIDGHDFRVSHIPIELRQAGRKKFDSFEDLSAWYLDHEGLNLNRSAGVCESLTKRLKKGGIIGTDWAWFADNKENLIIFDPEQGQEILEDVGFKVQLKPFHMEKKETTRLAKVFGMKCDLREHQIDPVCSWRKRMQEVQKDPDYLRTEPVEKRIPVIVHPRGEIRKLYKNEMEIYEKKGLEALKDEIKKPVKEVLVSSEGPEVAGGYIKSSTGSGKTVMGMVIIGTLGDVEIKEKKPSITKTEKPAKIVSTKSKSVRDPRKKLTREEVEKQVIEMRDKDISYADIEEKFTKMGIDYVNRGFIYRTTKNRGDD